MELELEFGVWSLVEKEFMEKEIEQDRLAVSIPSRTHTTPYQQPSIIHHPSIRKTIIIVPSRLIDSVVVVVQASTASIGSVRSGCLGKQTDRHRREVKQMLIFSFSLAVKNRQLQS